MAARSKAWVSVRSTAGIAGSCPSEGMDIRLLCLLCVVKVEVSAEGRSLVQMSPTGSVCDLEMSTMRLSRP